MRPDISEAYDEMDFSIDQDTGRLINIANYANLTGYFVLAGLIFIFAFAIFLFINVLKTATKRTGDLPVVDQIGLFTVGRFNCKLGSLKRPPCQRDRARFLPLL